MSRSSMDFDFAGAVKPCGGPAPDFSRPDKDKGCVGVGCWLYDHCDLNDKKKPWKSPVVVSRLPA